MSGTNLTGRLDEAARLWVESGGGVLPVSGRSMRPTFADASRILMEKADRLRFGDILVYTNGTFLVVHRVVGIRRGPLFRTKGDGLAHLDPGLVPPSRVLGRVVEIERAGRRYRTDGTAPRLYARLMACGSALEGFLYRFAYRIDRLLSPGRGSVAGARREGVTLLRRMLRRSGRLAIGLLDRTLFLRMHGPGSDAREAP